MGRRLVLAWRARCAKARGERKAFEAAGLRNAERANGESALRTVRKAQGLTLRQAAVGAGIDPGHLSRVERGEAQLSLNALRRLAKVLRLRDLERLLGECGIEASDA